MTDELEKMSCLFSKLSRQKDLAQFDTDEEAEAERLSHALCDLEQSFNRYVKELFPKLLAANDDDVLVALQDIGDELRHVAYHLRDSRFLAVYTDDGQKSL